jgi:hypothetical protein
MLYLNMLSYFSISSTDKTEKLRNNNPTQRAKTRRRRGTTRGTRRTRSKRSTSSESAFKDVGPGPDVFSEEPLFESVSRPPVSDQIIFTTT